MAIELTGRIRYRYKVRTWFRCDDCGTRGDYSMPAAGDPDALLDLMREKHHCSSSGAVTTA